MTSATAAPGQPGPRLNAAFYADSVAAFLRASDDEAYAPLASPHGYTLAPEQLSAWRLQLPVLRAGLGIWPRPRDCLGRKRGTGVPGAGKTLVGLNVATRHGSRDDAAHAVFLSGNGPLVAVLREARARDDLDRAKLTDPRARIGTSRTAVRAFIQNVHHFRDATLRDRSAPADHVVVFDEAQRAWDARQLASFMKRKKGLPGFTQTEPELLIGAMERHADWAVVVCLVGGGQEINTGEAGISAWLDGVRTLFPGWDIFISPHLTDSEYAATGALARLTESRAKREAKTVPATIFTSDVSTPRKRCLPPFPPRKRWLTPFPALAPSPPTPPSTSPPRCGPSARNTSPASSKPCSTAKPILAAISSPPFASSIQSCSRGACGRRGGGSGSSGGARSGRGWWPPLPPSGSSPTRSTYFPLTRLRLLACRIVSPMISSPR